MRRRIGNRQINRAPRENPKASRVTASEKLLGAAWMRPERPSRHRNILGGRRSPDRGSEKFAFTIAEVTDPLAL